MIPTPLSYFCAASVPLISGGDAKLVLTVTGVCGPTQIVSMNELRQACISPALKDQVVLTDGETSIQVLG